MILPFVTLDLMWDNENAGSGSIESILYFVSTVLGIIKHVCIAVSQKRLDINLNAAIDDWLSTENNEEMQKIMKKYAARARLLTLMLLYSAGGCFSIYISAIVFINLKQIFFTDPLNGKIYQYIILLSFLLCIIKIHSYIDVSLYVQRYSCTLHFYGVQLMLIQHIGCSWSHLAHWLPQSLVRNMSYSSSFRLFKHP